MKVKGTAEKSFRVSIISILPNHNQDLFLLLSAFLNTSHHYQAIAHSLCHHSPGRLSICNLVRQLHLACQALQGQHSFPPHAHQCSGLQFGFDLFLALHCLSSHQFFSSKPRFGGRCRILMSRNNSQFFSQCPQQACCHALLSLHLHRHGY